MRDKKIDAPGSAQAIHPPQDYLILTAVLVPLRPPRFTISKATFCCSLLLSREAVSKYHSEKNVSTWASTC